MSVSERQLNELRGRQSLDEVRDSHQRVVAEKDKQLAELTTVLKRQTEELKKHRLSVSAFLCLKHELGVLGG